MSLAVHCHLVSHKFNEFIVQGVDPKEYTQRMKIIKVSLPIICYACPRTSKHTDLSQFIEHIIKIHLQTKKGLRDKKNTLLESDIRRAVTRFPPTFMDTIPPNIRCIQCAENEDKKKQKPMKKLAELKAHIQKNHTEIPKFRCIFCPPTKERFSSMKRERMYQHINAQHANVRANGETDKSLLDSCLVDSSLLWKCYGINEK